MRRFERFAASQLIWIITIAILFLNLDALRLSNQPFLWIGIALSMAILINLGIWFGEGIARAFDDDLYENTEKKTDSETESVEKRKRERIDTVLRDLSDDDLLVLQQRLQDGAIDDNILYEHMVGDDGELIERN